MVVAGKVEKPVSLFYLLILVRKEMKHTHTYTHTQENKDKNKQANKKLQLTVKCTLIERISLCWTE